jgi:hypothetical protein
MEWREGGEEEREGMREGGKRKNFREVKQRRQE